MEFAPQLKIVIGILIVAQTIVAIVQSVITTKLTKKKIENELKAARSSQEKYEKLIHNLNEKLHLSQVRHEELIYDLNEKLNTYWYNSFKQDSNRHTIPSPYGAIPPSYGSIEQRSLFFYRMHHFVEEKRRIAENYVNSLLDNLKEINGHKKVFLLLDSGSTIFHVFEVLCNAYHLGNDEEKAALAKISIITNNVMGANRLTEIGRAGGSIQADMLFDCFILPGAIEGKYNAILGKETADYISTFIESSDIIVNDIFSQFKSCIYSQPLWFLGELRKYENKA